MCLQPQGAVLGHLLFIIAINYILNCNFDHKIIYTDYTQVFLGKATFLLPWIIQSRTDESGDLEYTRHLEGMHQVFGGVFPLVGG